MKRFNKSPDGVVLHCSDSEFGDADLVRAWHKERGFEDIGYHAIVLNGHLKSTKKADFRPDMDGVVVQGRSEKFRGSHAVGHNDHTLAICLIGKGNYSESQLASLQNYIKAWCYKYPSIKNLWRHDDLNDSGKTCPNLPDSTVRQIADSMFLTWEKR